MSTRGPVLVAGSIAQRPGVGGHAWVFLQWLLGLRALGWDPIFVDRLEPGMCEDPGGRPCAPGRSRQLAHLAAIMEDAGLGDAWALLSADGETFGCSRRELVRRARAAPLVLNVMGFLDDDEVLAGPALRAFVDIDPGFPQMWRELGLHDAFAGHDAFVSVGACIGRDGCEVPTCGLDWIGIRPPVALDAWPADGPPGAAFTTVASWRGPFGPVERAGRRFGLRVHEFRRFLELPGRTGERFDVALDIHADERGDIDRLQAAGWHLLDPRVVASGLDDYRAFIRASRAELMVAKEMYVATRGGWFSDRSACYLATGRAVVAQDTGFTAHLPTGEGLLAFSTVEEAARAVEQVAADPVRHGTAARALAEEFFDARRVLADLLDRLGVT